MEDLVLSTAGKTCQSDGSEGTLIRQAWKIHQSDISKEPPQNIRFRKRMPENYAIMKNQADARCNGLSYARFAGSWKGRQSHTSEHLLFGKAGVFILKIKKQQVLAGVLTVLTAVQLMGCGEVKGGSAANDSVAESQNMTADADVPEDGEDASAGAPEASSDGVETLADGTYVPTLFTFSGGSGRIEITCPLVTVTEGEAEAEIVFSSSHYTRVVIENTEYLPVNASDDNERSHFWIPVQLDEDMEITATTTAMSEPHDITYIIHISLTEQQTEGTESEDSDIEVSDAGVSDSQASDSEAADVAYASDFDPESIPELSYISEKEIQYAETFSVYEYEDGYRIIDVADSACYLVVPEGLDVPNELPENVTVLQQPLDTVYLAATSVMSLYNAIGSLDDVKYTGTDVSGWYIDAPKEALESGAMIYAGKYSAPDYELLVSGGVNLAIESTMILHAPEVKEKLEDLGIPVFIDTSSKESHPLGRTEWIRIYGILAGEEEKADACFAEEAAKIEAIIGTDSADARINSMDSKAGDDAADSDDQNSNTGDAHMDLEKSPVIAFFSLSSDGTVSVRRSGDYIANMITMAGGEYLSFDSEEDTSSGATVSVSMEAFYAAAKDADILIYNSAIESALTSADELLTKDALFADFRAVQEGQVWQVKKSLYQSTDCVGELILDLSDMLAGADDTDMKFLEHLS